MCPLTKYEEYIERERAAYKTAIIQDVHANMNALIKIGAMSIENVKTCIKCLEDNMYILDSEMGEIHLVLDSLSFTTASKVYDSTVWVILQTRVVSILKKELPTLLIGIEDKWLAISPPVLH
jgi:hypothetical protein